MRIEGLAGLDAELSLYDLLRQGWVLRYFDAQRQIIDDHLLYLDLYLILRHLTKLPDQNLTQRQVLAVSQRGVFALKPNLASISPSIQLILLCLNNQTVGNQVEDTFSHMPVRVPKVAYCMVRKLTRRTPSDQYAAAFEHCLPNYYLAV